MTKIPEPTEAQDDKAFCKHMTGFQENPTVSDYIRSAYLHIRKVLDEGTPLPELTRGHLSQASLYLEIATEMKQKEDEILVIDENGNIQTGIEPIDKRLRHYENTVDRLVDTHIRAGRAGKHKL